MKILKYLLFLLLLSLATIFTFTATQAGVFEFSKSKIINAKRTVIYQYVSNFSNWPTFFIDDVKLANNVVANKSEYEWKDDTYEGEVSMLKLVSNDLIKQKMILNHDLLDVQWTFKDTLGGTKVTVNAKGRSGFYSKLKAFFKFDFLNSSQNLFEKSLDNLNEAMDSELSTFELKGNEIVLKPELYYIAQTFTSASDKLLTNYNIVIPKLYLFCKENNIQTVGKPFIIHHSHDKTTNVSKISIGIGINSQIFVSAGSDINTGVLKETEAIQNTLKGHVSHINKAVESIYQYAIENKLKTDKSIAFIEQYEVSKNETGLPSKWLTNIYVPFEFQIALKTQMNTTVKKQIRKDSTISNLSNQITPKPIIKKTIVVPTEIILPKTNKVLPKSEFKKKQQQNSTQPKIEENKTVDELNKVDE